MIKMYSEHTVRLVNLMESPQVNPLIDKALSLYPLYKPTKTYDLIPSREELNMRILNHYKYYEIGAETIGRFLDELKITMSEIMPYYNELFKTVEIMADLPNPFDNVDVTETIEETRTGTSSTTGNSESFENASVETSETGKETNEGSSQKNRKFSDTPQNAINDIDRYMTDYTEENENGKSENNVDRNGTSESNQSTSAETSAQSCIRTVVYLI